MTMMTGIVEAVSTKDVTTKFGTKPTYSIKINGGWVKCGFKNHNANVGDEVEFDGNTGTYGLETKAVAVLRRGAGAGRLIRSESDQGVLVVCDPRLTSMSYGRRLLACLPPMRRIHTEAEFVSALNLLTKTATTR